MITEKISDINILTFKCPYCNCTMNTTINSDEIAWTKCNDCGAILVADNQDDMTVLISSIKRSMESIL